MLEHICHALGDEGKVNNAMRTWICTTTATTVTTVTAVMCSQSGYRIMSMPDNNLSGQQKHCSHSVDRQIIQDSEQVRHVRCVLRGVIIIGKVEGKSQQTVGPEELISCHIRQDGLKKANKHLLLRRSYAIPDSMEGTTIAICEMK